MSVSSRKSFFQKSDSPHNVEEIKSIEDIITKGKFLGSGAVGRAYKVGDKVYKILDFNPGWYTPAYAARRCIKHWDILFKRFGFISPEYKELVGKLTTATIPDKNGVKFQVFISPFINGKSAKDFEEFDYLMKKSSYGMYDKKNSGNVLIEENTKKPVPVDMDNVFPLDDRNGPPSPMTRKCREYTKFDKDLENRDQFAFRSYFMMK